MMSSILTCVFVCLFVSLFTEGLKEHFSKFGDIAEVMVMKDPATRRYGEYSSVEVKNQSIGT